MGRKLQYVDGNAPFIKSGVVTVNTALPEGVTAIHAIGDCTISAQLINDTVSGDYYIPKGGFLPGNWKIVTAVTPVTVLRWTI